jgi:hypothetical protein
MSIANLFVPNDLNLFCGTITTSGAGPGDTFSKIFVTDTTNQIVLGSTNTVTINSSAPSVDVTLNLPNTNDTLVGRITNDTFENKTIYTDENTVVVQGYNLDSIINQPVNMTSSPIFSNLTLNGITLDNTQTNLLVLNGSNTLNYRALSTDNPFNQNLNTTNSVTFANITDTGITGNTVVSTNSSNVLVGTALTNGQVLIGSTLAAPVAATLTGTTNEVNVANAAGSITLSLPQAIATTSSPTFSGLSITPASGIPQIVLTTSASKSCTIAVATAIFNYYNNAAAGDTCIPISSGQQIRMGPANSSTDSPVSISSTSVQINATLNLTTVANDNSQTSILMSNPSQNVVYRTVASLGIPSTNSTVTYQGLILDGTTDSVIQLQSVCYIALAGTNAYLFTNTLANDLVIQNASVYRILIGVGTGTSQLVVGNTSIQNNSYIYGGLSCMITVQIAAGTGASASITGASQTGGILSITAGSTATPTTGQLAIITLPIAVPIAIYGIQLTPASVAGSGAALLATSIYSAALSTTTWAIYTGTVALTANASYAWAWSLCM